MIVSNQMPGVARVAKAYGAIKYGIAGAVLWAAVASPFLFSEAFAEPEIGKTYGDWTIACTEASKERPRKCFARQVQVHRAEEEGEQGPKQRLIDARVGFIGPNGEPALVTTLPLGISIRAGVALRIDKQKPIPLQLEFCTRAGCQAVTILDGKTLKALQMSHALSVRFAPRASRNIVSIRLSPKGLFTAVEALK